MTAPESGAAPGQPYGVVPPLRPAVPPYGPPQALPMAQPGSAGWPMPPAQPLPPVSAVPPALPMPPASPVPPGPGVRPPFAAPPIRKESGTLIIGLLLGGFALLVCMLGGGIGFGGALVNAMRETEEQAMAAATEYLDALKDGRYVDAYQMTCGPFRKKVPQREFVTDKQFAGPLVDYELRPIEATEEGQLMVPVKLVSAIRETNIGLVMAWEPASGGTDSRDRDVTVRVCEEVALPSPGPS